VSRKAKIVVTIGPASQDRKALTALLNAGMDVARLNLSHGHPSEHVRVIREIRRLSRLHDRPVSVIADLPGPKIRSGRLEGGSPVVLRRGGQLILSGRHLVGTPSRIGITYPKIAAEVSPGDRILLSDGLIELKVRGVRKGEVICRVVHGGDLGEMQGVNLPGVNLSVPSLTSADRKQAAFALEHGVDYIAQSFVRSASDVRKLKSLIRRRGSDTPVLAKIEKPEALDDLEAILQAADGVMVARGDLGVEMSPEKVPAAQKRIIALAKSRRRLVITATQMLESMMENPRPTRAEASDVANAILDGTDAVMLSGETASGLFPIEAVEMMRRRTLDRGLHRERLHRASRIQLPPGHAHHGLLTPPGGPPAPGPSLGHHPSPDPEGQGGGSTHRGGGT
jgi:pyruvate kinase